MSKKKVYFSKYINEEKIILEPNITSRYKNDEEDKKHRFSMTIPFWGRRDGGHAVVILKNPSKAGKLDEDNRKLSDDTIYKVLDYLYKHENNYAKVTILNLFSIYGPVFKNIATQIEKVEELSVDKNQEVLSNIIKSYNPQKDVIILAWGGYPDLNDKKMKEKIGEDKKAEIKKFYKHRINEVEKMLKDITVYKVGKLTGKGFPAHGKSWYDYEALTIYEPENSGVIK
ncbi:TPA: DUF1643 domain-containing protein [Bacillus wiedmannii]|nr:DUF1643 domain-containing protein [Bacillus wiedmannii]